MTNLKTAHFGDRNSTTQVARIEGVGTTELYICARPTRDEGRFDEQALSMYENLFHALSEHGAGPRNVITEKVFFSDVDRQFLDLGKIRKDWYNHTMHTTEYLPATIFLHQPPCHPGRLCELQVYVLFSTGGDEVKVRPIQDAPGLASGKVVEHHGIRHLYLTNLTGGEDIDNLSFSEQAEDMFARAEQLLGREGLSFPDVVRTWIYVNDIERDYDDLNRVRTRFFREHSVDRLPASTGIQGATYPRERACAMDLYTLVGEHPVEIETVHATTMDEAWEYGSSFSRGMKVAFEDRIVLYVSGTASIDQEGTVMHVGDIEGQVNRMLLNVEQLLEAQYATPGDLVSIITYLKKPQFLAPFYRVYAQRSFPKNAPNTVSVADVCRPEWLCEMEAIAVLPRG
ncbi:MAG: RidA family protein [Candidatus Latescibacterota bacterium]